MRQEEHEAVWTFPALLFEALGELEGDELDVVGIVVERLRVGRKGYGQLFLMRDGREWRQERDEEIADGLVYAACLALSGRPRREGSEKEAME
jgi:hypothetical protein